MDLKALIFGRRIGRLDLGVLKIALMVAALDGEVTAAEYAAFDEFARKCRGYTPSSGASALREAMRAAGYLLLLSKRVSDDELVRAFIDEVGAALPADFALYAPEDVRAAFVIWVSMAMSDGDYSPRERGCIEALFKYFEAISANGAAWITSASSALSGALATGSKSAPVPARERFLARVEDFLRSHDLADPAAEQGYDDLVAHW